MGGACSTYGGEERCIRVFGGKNVRERDHLDYPGVDGRIRSKRIFKKWYGGWTGLIWLRIGTGGGHL